jgi:hypothetical protein
MFAGVDDVDWLSFDRHDGSRYDDIPDLFRNAATGRPALAEESFEKPDVRRCRRPGSSVTLI